MSWHSDDVLFLFLELDLAQLDEVLRDLRQALLRLVHDKVGPVYELLVDLLERRRVPVREPHTLPLPPRRVCTLGRLDIQIHHALLLAHGSVPRVGEGARLPVAQTGQVVFIAAERLVRRRLDLVRAKVVPDERPHHVVRLHRDGRLEKKFGAICQRGHTEVEAKGGGGGPPGNALQEGGAPMATGARALRPRPSGARCACRRSGAPRATPACRPPACHPRRAPPRQTR